MKALFRVSVFLAACLMAAACGQSVVGVPTQVSSPTGTLTAIPSQTMFTATPLPSPTATATLAPIPTPTYIIPTLLPTIDPESLPGLLSKTFSVRAFTSLSGYNIQQVTGWEYGFEGESTYGRDPGYYWLDASHLLLYPRLGEQVNGFSGGREDLAYQPAVINLENGYVWLPGPGVDWSSELGMLIDTGYKTSSEGDQREAVYIYTFDGQRTAYYWGKLIGVSPSKTKILIDNTWIDLKSGKKVAFDWESDLEKEYDIYFPQPLWSSDETQVYACCYKYGNARTGESFTFPPDEVSVDGEKFAGSLNHSDGKWVLNDSHLLVQFDFFNSLILDFIPLYDLNTRSLHNLNTLAGIPTNKYGPNCEMVFAAPDGQSVWANCYSGDYLIDLSTFKSVEYLSNNSYDYPTWSANGDFAWIAAEPRQLLSVRSKKLSSLPVEPLLYSKLWWHPSEDVIVYPSTDDNKVIFLDAATMLYQELPFALQKPPVYDTVINVVWSPYGKELALVAEDGSIWQVDYPTLKSLKQLTIPFPEVSDVNWSPDGRSIAFVSGSDIYIVDTMK